MRALNLKPTRMHRIATQAIESKSIPRPPCWYNIMGMIPPAEIMTRTQPVTHMEVKRKTKSRKPSKMFRPLPIMYIEDALRDDFFADHPWELARPRIVLENDGRDGQKCDWSRGLRQPGRMLSGESVVQRQLWLMRSMSKVQAYDIARKEFYALRHQEEVERRVAKEEASMVGAYWGKSILDVGMQLEDKVYERWKEWAVKEVQAIELQRDSAYTGIGTVNDDEVSTDIVEAFPETPEETPIETADATPL